MPLIEQRLASLQERLDAISQVIANVEKLTRLIARWSESVADSQHHLSFLDRLQLAFRNAQNLFDRLWNFELYNALDTIEVNGQKKSPQCYRRQSDPGRADPGDRVSALPPAGFPH